MFGKFREVLLRLPRELDRRRGLSFGQGQTRLGCRPERIGAFGGRSRQPTQCLPSQNLVLLPQRRMICDDFINILNTSRLTLALG